MDKPEMSEVLAKAKALNLPEGLIVRSLDGRSFFLTKEETDRKTLTPETNEAIGKIFEKAAKYNFPKGYHSCDEMLEWLLTTDPFSEDWRAYSFIWALNC